jgi:aryl-alcohol dehydrogenase-like predicted oxidoreductase
MRAHGAGFLPFYPLASGFLTGKYRRAEALPAEGRITKGKRYSDKWLTEEHWTVLEQLEAFCKSRGRTMVELAFSWLAAQPVISSIIAGATKPEQLDANINAANWKLTAEELAEIDTITGKP